LKGSPLSFKAKKDFISQNQTFPAEELASKTSLNLRQVKKLLEKLKTEKQIAVILDNGVSEKIRYRWAIALIPVLLTFLVYLPSLGNGFVNWDDPDNILNNMHIRSLDFSSLKWMFTSFFRGFWFPLNLLSLALDYRIGGLDPRVYHVHSLILHCLNTFLFYHICLRVLELVLKNINRQKPTNWVTNSSFLASLLFGLHPLHVETVAWATDRKDVLCGFYYLAALLVYLDYVSSGKKWKLYVCFCIFVLSLMSKPMAVTFPLVFILLDVWPLGRFGREIKIQENQDKKKRAIGLGPILEKVPFFLSAAIVGLLAPLAEFQIGAMPTMQDLPFISRVANSFYSIFFQLWKMVIPLNLSALYPFNVRINVFTVENIVSVILFVLVSSFCFYYRYKWPFLGIGWLSFLVTLAPVSGLFQTGAQITADRYTYLTCLAPFLLLACGIARLLFDRKWIMILASMVLMSVLGWLTILQTQTWKDSIALWENVVKVYPGISYLAYSNLALAYATAGRIDDALLTIDLALAIDPKSVRSHNDKGVLLIHKGLVNEAIQEFQNTIALDPKQALAHLNLGKSYYQIGRLADAKTECETALSLDPGYAEAFDSLGIIYSTQGKMNQAIDSFNKAHAIEPENTKYVLALASVYQKLNKFDESIELFKRAIDLNPQEWVCYFELGLTYKLKGMYPDAIEQLKKASELQPQNSDILKKLGSVYLKVGQTDLADESIRKAVALEAVGH
jgi:tetratricopeptide (TPR) repeat protein